VIDRTETWRFGTAAENLEGTGTVSALGQMFNAKHPW
jgi:hypothetical protein